MSFRGAISSKTGIYILSAAFLILGALALAMFGFGGVGRGDGNFASDMLYLFVAGEMWEAGSSPYVFDMFREDMKSIVNIDSVSYAYPPNSALLALALSSGSVGMAKILIGVMNLIAIGVLCAFVAAGAAQTRDVHPGRLRVMAVITAAVVIGNPFTAHVVWLGQTTLISAAFLYAAWLVADRRMDVLAGVLLGLAAFKPQLAFVVGLWFLLDRRWLLLVVAGAATLLMSAWPLVTTGLDGSWLDWPRALSDYQGGTFNLISFKHVFGLRSLLASAGIMVPSMMPLAILGVIALFWVRHQYEQIWLINAILILSFLLLYAHDYDLAPVAVLTFPLLIASRGRSGLLLLICVMACIIFFPQRLWEKLDLSQMARSREIALMGILATYLVVGRTVRRPTARPARAMS
ncbi:DUF2029 domain-containing protein [Paracoccus sp. TK19116]|uniref:DUF2029 domain-containing protein n=1 Tax=Paracoccus albicereus TaxID=2922394 RepID=A0ABT1MPW3_9RHOB|nr:glycosyltransferase 87 family protein [Paracoccus albicereus]MCQ0970164.1 DUF2029 domain-containing protein [Paracoccus albicereus]